jgi:soluble lytic murein transglycosylase-like protein
MRLLPLVFLLLLPQSALGGDLAEYDHIITAACAHFNVPKKLVVAIAKQESGHNPWAVNVAGRGYQPKSQDEALAIANAAWAKGQSFDLGLMQINSFWLRRFNITPEYVIEPGRNIIIGTWILSREVERYGLSWRAVASYHTPVEKNPERGRKYAASVIDILRRQK